MNLAVTGSGVICSVGRNSGDSCASIRAGIVRSQEIGYFDLLDPETQEPLPLVGHPVRGVTEGFSDVGRWMRLAERCLIELLAGAGFARDSRSELWEATGLVAVTPHIDDARFYGDGNEGAALLLPAYVAPLIRRLRLPISESRVAIVTAGHTGVITAMLRASELVGRSVDRVIVVAVDSYLDVLTLEWLAQQSRLKSPDSPLGLMPGEAGVALLVEDPVACKRRGGTAQAFVSGAAVTEEPSKVARVELNQGIGLSGVIDKVLSASSVATPFGGDIFSDLNGEEWRSRELAGAFQRLNGRLSDRVRFVLPAASTGDVGAASAGISICAAVRSQERGYSAEPHSLVLGSSDRGDVGAALISASS